MDKEIKISLNNIKETEDRMKYIFIFFCEMRKKLKEKDMDILKKIERYSHELLSIKNLNN